MYFDLFNYRIWRKQALYFLLLYIIVLLLVFINNLIVFLLS
jgi:hypothetical protein